MRFNSLKVAFNNAFRILHNLNKRCSAIGSFANNNVKSYTEMYQKSVFSFMNRIYCSQNVIISTIANPDFYADSSLRVLWCKHVYK